ncbi:DUF4174 domain-containing protein [Hymenobacter yonginensis]|uniref:DUF4174 domain-containing protein n=1 Tax=Hymenobacter yonginensis TaxID=748197 RepID=A0ABY7PKJ0_9BACT|nr:DUF4174 domain-containing protein [Hymenobacter yonginensis]WBO83189.1 DUF4174 domain-containing protein [Hymenobacter yonginensis]
MRSAFAYIGLLAAFLMNPVSIPAQTAPKPTSVAALLKASRWQQRVLLLYAPTATDPALLRQRELLRGAGPELEARQLLVRELVGSTLSAADARYLAQQLGVAPGGFAVVLIGKDGGVKKRATQPLPPASLFATIDAMPMRRQEMRQQP